MQLYPNQRIPYADKIKNDNEWGRKMLDYLARYSNLFNNNYARKLSNYRLFNNQLDQKDFERDCNAMGIDVGQWKDEVLPYNKTYNKIQVLLGEELKRPFKFTVALVNASGIRKKERAKTDMLQNWIEATVEQYGIQVQQEQQQKKLALDEKYKQLKLQQQKEQSPAQMQEQQTMQEIQQMQQQQDDQLEQQYQQELDMQSKKVQARMDNLVPPNEIDKWYSSKYRDSREILSSKMLNYLVQRQDLKSKKNDGFKHGCISGEEIVYVGIEGNEPVVKVINPLNLFYHKSVDTKYMQDGLFAGQRTFMTNADILSIYGDYLSEEDQKSITGKLEGSATTWGTSTSNPNEYATDTVEDMFWQDSVINNGLSGNLNMVHGQYSARTSQELQVVHAEWVSQRQVGFLTFTNEFNEEETVLVDENFIVPKNARKEKKKVNGKNVECAYFTIEEEGMDEQGQTTIVPKEYKYEAQWIPQVWEGVRIGMDKYCCIQPKRHAYFSIDHPNKTKLGYHGVIYNNMNAESVSIMDRMRPYQMLYFIVMHKMKKLVAQDRGKILHLDTSMIPADIGHEKTMYYLQELNIDLYNPLENIEVPGGYQRGGKVTQTSDWSNMQYILSYVQLLNYLDGMIGDSAGVTRQREGQSSPDEAVRNVQSDLTQSAVVTEIFFNIHNKLWEDVLNSLLSTARRFYKDSKQSHIQYILDDLSLETLSLSEDDLEDSDIGVFATSSIQENDIFNTLKSLSQALLQNDKANMSHIIDILESNSLAELKKDIKQFEKETAEKEQAAYDNQMKQQQDAQAYARETMMMKEKEITDRELKKAEIDVFKFQKDLDVDNDGIPDFIEVQKLKLQQETNEKDRILKEKELNMKKDELKAKERIEKYKVDNKPRPTAK
jgi:hypothetical protein